MNNPKPTNEASTSKIAIKGMHCGSCVAKVTTALSPLAEQVAVTLKPAQAILSQCRVSLAEINSALAQAGDYQATALAEPIQAETQAQTLAQAAQINAQAQYEPSKSWLVTYQPLFIILAYILGVSLLIELHHGAFAMERWMMHFMAGFFLVFSFFKMLNLKAFANTYAMYDLLAMRSKAYGFIYPFIELALGIAYLLGFAAQTTNALTLIIMGFSSLGVIRAVMNKQKIKCACLGAVFDLPMSTITIIEDLLMAAMAAWMLL